MERSGERLPRRPPGRLVAPAVQTVFNPGQAPLLGNVGAGWPFLPGAAWLVLRGALLLAGLALLILLGALLGLLRLLFLGLPLRLFAQCALTQRGFVLPALLLLLAGGFRLLTLLVVQQPLLLTLGLRLRVAPAVGPGWLAQRCGPVRVAVVLCLLAQSALAQRFFVLWALQAAARLLLLLAGQLPLLALLVEACALFGVPRVAVLLHQWRGQHRQRPFAA